MCDGLCLLGTVCKHTALRDHNFEMLEGRGGVLERGQRDEAIFAIRRVRSHAGALAGPRRCKASPRFSLDLSLSVRTLPCGLFNGLIWPKAG